MATQTFTTTGTWVVPTNVHSVVAECWGAGGSGGGQLQAASGGGGGGYAKKTLTNSLTPGNSLTVTVGVGGASVAGIAGNGGGDSWFSTAGTVLAKGGSGGQVSATVAAGSAGGTANIGDTTFNGGASGSATRNGATSASGGGGGAGSAGNGGASANSTGPANSVGGTAGTPDGGAGGNGNTSPTTGGTGVVLGGGGGAVCNSSGTSSGAGANGQIKLTWTVDPTTRYWVGGTGNWDASNTTNWAYTSGGASGATVPTSTNDVLFDANSGAGTVTITATANCLSLDFTGYTQTISGSSALNVYGSLTFSSGMTNSYTGALTFLATSSGKTITTNTKAITNPIFNGVGGVWTLQDNFTSPLLTLTNGTLIPQSNTITLTGSGTVWNATSGSYTPGTSTIKLTNSSSSSKTFAGANMTYNNLWLSGAGTGIYIISGSNTFTDFKVDTPPHTINFTAGSRQTVSTFTVSGTAGNLNTLQSTVSGTQWGLASSSTISIDYVSLQDSKAIKL